MTKTRKEITCNMEENSLPIVLDCDPILDGDPDEIRRVENITERLFNLWINETDEPETKAWRKNLNDEERDIVAPWDALYLEEYLRALEEDPAQSAGGSPAPVV